ncbi:hypothetical protein B0T22DRAFT_43743 [Podospora appendiculata]|uniref:Uncharacterized protein n=1 Tax=Podospora appendiculata TaxID=314037 RepID=A0AAE0XHI1_9PEZI|nr:hypothetical protein B0T22DRAFT_43743 [Podospora appendiculata]
MDILFSPHHVGALPASAQAKVEKRAESLRTTSFQKMLDLEKKHKLERLHSAPVSSPPPPPPFEEQDRSALQSRRADSFSQKQSQLMLKAAPRSSALPSLSINIPQSPGGDCRDISGDKGLEKERQGPGDGDSGTATEPAHKQVKFLASGEHNDIDEEYGDMSDQSSICHSPTWEGYGQKKKEKKKEAERRKKEKELADKEAKAATKAAKKRLAARLSKPPPPTTTGGSAGTGTLTSADRSMSDPLLVSRHLILADRFTPSPEVDGRAASTNNLQPSWTQRPVTADMLPDSGPSGRRFVGGVKLDQERERAIYNDTQSQDSPASAQSSVSDGGIDLRQHLRNSNSDGLGSGSQSSASSVVARHDNRSPREAFPPSASRTPMLRHAPASGHSRNGSLLQGAEDRSMSNLSQESLPALLGNERGRQREGYVGHQRTQSTERAMATLSDEQLASNASHNSSSTRSSSRGTQHTRRSSLTREAMAMAMRLAGLRPTASAKEHPVKSNGLTNQTDYFGFIGQSHSNPVLDTLNNNGRMPTSPRTQDNVSPDSANDRQAVPEKSSSRGTGVEHEPVPAQGRPVTSQGLPSSREPSYVALISSNQSKKGRSLRDATRAALNMSPKGSAAQTNTPKHSAPFVLRSRLSFQSQPSASAERSTHFTAPESTEGSSMGLPLKFDHDYIQSVSSATPSSSNSVKTTEVETQPGSRVSEGSSTSSTYEDASPLPSPTTTPDTSRPQSSKDMPLVDSRNDSRGSLDDEKTLRQSLELSAASSTSTTPRLDGSETRETAEMAEEDRWSRTALPLEIDGEGQSHSAPSGTDDRQPVTTAQSQQRLSKSISDPEFRIWASAKVANSNNSPPVEQVMSIPPRSKRRDSQRLSSRDDTYVESSNGRRSRNTQDGRATNEPKERNAGAAFQHHDSDQSGADERRDAKRENSKPRHLQQQQRPKSRRQGKSARSLSSGDERGNPKSHVSPNNGPVLNSIASNDEVFLSVSSSNPFSEDPSDSTQDRFATVSAETLFPDGVSAGSSQKANRLPGPARMLSAPVTSSGSTEAPPQSGPASRPIGATPVSILKQSTRSTSELGNAQTPKTAAPILSALPKHMQLQAGISTRQPAATPAENRITPLAKMLVECCSCKFYHDLPSKVYECMAKPDAVVEDRTLGISGAITTMVKCPWCQHNMSTKCCAGYAAVVYLKEKLH